MKSVRLSMFNTALLLMVAPAYAVPVTGYSLWLDATDSSTVVFGTGSQVLTWKDKSGNGQDVTQATSAKQPLLISNGLNYRPVIRFDGTDDYLRDTSSDVLNSMDHTVFLVMKATRPAAVPAGLEQDIVSYGSSGTSGRYIYTRNNGLHFQSGSTTGDAVNNTYGANNLVIFYGVLQSGASAGKNFIRDPTGGTTTTTSGTYLASRTNTVNTLDIGDYNNGAAGSFYNGDIAELLFYTSVLNSTQLQQNVDYLYDKWFVPYPEPSSLLLSITGCSVVFRLRRKKLS